MLVFRLFFLERSAFFKQSLVLCIFLFFFAGSGFAQNKKIEFLYFSQEEERPPSLSNLEIPPENVGSAGGLLGIKDNNTTGRFLNQEFSLETANLNPEKDAVAEYKKIIKKKPYRYVILNVPAKTLLRLSDLPESSKTIFFNAGAKDNVLREKECRKNVFHTSASYAMLSDAMAQFLMTKNWKRWMLIKGTKKSDQLFAGAITDSAKKFGAKIIKEKEWSFGPDTRRTAQAEIPVFTQGIEVDMIVVADVLGIFGEYLAYRTWSPNLIAGTQGLITTSWHWTQEQWGAAQLQSRFTKTFERKMQELDYSVWQGVRAIGEAATRTGSADFDKIRGYLLNEKFTLAGFKGVKLTFRKWNRQLRQPILLVTDTALVSVSPQRKYLHRTSQLDTLGTDRPNSDCKIPG